MTHQRVVELWKQIETILCSTVDPFNELFDVVYEGKYEKEYITIIQKILSVQEDLTLIEMQRSMQDE